MLRITVPASLALVFLTSVSSGAAEDLAVAKRTYAEICSHCHGVNMVNAGTTSFDLRKFPRDGKERFFNSVKNGKGNMPAWGDVLTDEDLTLLWYYVNTRGGKEAFEE